MDREAIRQKLAELRPNAGATVPTTMDVDPLKVWRTPGMEVSARDLKALAETNPKHPVAQSFAKAVANAPDNQRVTVHQIDLQALLEGKESIIDETLENGSIIMTKRIGGEWKESANPVDLPRPETAPNVSSAPNPSTSPAVAPEAPGKKPGVKTGD